MPEYTETRTPYEFLVRWDEAGALQGAHVQFIERTFRDGVKIAENLTAAEGVALAEGDTGFALGTIVSQLVVDQQMSLDALNASVASLTAQLEAALADAAALQARLDKVLGALL